MKVLVTGSSGLIGSEAVEHFDRQGHEVFGVDNNMRRVFFGPPGDTLWNLERLKSATRQFTPVPLDIRDRDGVMALFRENRFDLVIHCAAQPSHDKAAEIAHTAHHQHTSLRAAALKLGYLSEKEFDELVKPENMTHP